MGGSFTSAGSCLSVDGCNNIARWNTFTNTWSALTTGASAAVQALVISGSDLYVGGDFTSAGGVEYTSYIARWNGSIWSPLFAGKSNRVNAIAFSGDELYAGGLFWEGGYIARWHEGAWSYLDTGVNKLVFTISVGSEAVCAEGNFSIAGGVPAHYIARYQENYAAYLPLIYR